MAHNVLSYGSPEAARRANRAINKVAQDGGFVGVKPTERRVHTAVSSQTEITIAYNGYFTIVDTTEYSYDDANQLITPPQYSVGVLDGLYPGSSTAGICRVNSNTYKVSREELVIPSSDLSTTTGVQIYLVMEEEVLDNVETPGYSHTPIFYFIAGSPPEHEPSGKFHYYYIIGDVFLSNDNTLRIIQRHGTSGFTGNGEINLLRFAQLKCKK